MMTMNEETERRLAVMIMEEAKRLRAQADEEGVHVYLSKPTVRVRPNPQFLQATVRSVQQVNRMAEVNEMWRRRAAELESEHERDKHRRKQNNPVGHHHSRASGHFEKRQTIDGVTRANLDDLRVRRAKGSNGCDSNATSNGKETCREFTSTVSSRNNERFEDVDAANHSEGADRASGGSFNDDYNDLGDEELEEFLLARMKRGRGAVGSRMDETGPYPAPHLRGCHQPAVAMRVEEDWEARIAGPSVVRGKESIFADKIWKVEKKKKTRTHRSTLVDQKKVIHKSEKRKKGKKEKKERRQRDEYEYQNSLKRKKKDSRV